MKLIVGAVIATAAVIILGVLIIIPSFFETESTNVMLTITVYDQPNLATWCQNLSEFLEFENGHGAIFISGEVAQKNPSCVTSFSKNFDIGSQTFSYVSLPQISDYRAQLEEVKKGKDAIDKVGNLDSRLFKAPFSDTDENIYSLLTNNEILADFSYQNQYNKFFNGKFLKFDLLTINSKDISAKSLQSIKSSKIPVQIEFDSSMTIDEIKNVFSQIKSSNIDFVTASDIAQMELTGRN